MAKYKRVIVVGGGVGGMTVALALHRAGIPVEIHERHDSFQHHTTGFTIWSHAVASLLKLGVSLGSAGQPIEQTEIRNQAGELICKMPVGEISRSLGADSYEMQRDAMLKAIAAELPDGALCWDSECVEIEEVAGQACVRMADGSEHQADLVIGADGIHSVTREAVAGKVALRPSGYCGAAAVIQFSHPDCPPHTHIDVWGHGGKAGIADIGQGRLRWYTTWKVSRKQQGPQAGRRSKAEILAHLENWYGPIGDIVRATPEGQIRQNVPSDIPPITRWFRGRVVLLGDAAHATTPFAAMGANMAIEDSMELAELINRCDHIEQALKEFQELRKKRTEGIVKHGRFMARMTQLHSPLAAWLRDQAFLHMPAEEIERVTKEMASGS